MSIHLDFSEYDVPSHTAIAIENYILHGLCPGGFVESVFTGDLFRATTIADMTNCENLYYITRWVLDNAPKESVGTLEKMSNWISDVDGCRTKYAESLSKKQVWENLNE